jgi:hypothetical protein
MAGVVLMFGGAAVLTTVHGVLIALMLFFDWPLFPRFTPLHECIDALIASLEVLKAGRPAVMGNAAEASYTAGKTILGFGRMHCRMFPSRSVRLVPTRLSPSSTRRNRGRGEISLPIGSQITLASTMRSGANRVRFFSRPLQSLESQTTLAFLSDGITEVPISPQNR